MMTSLWIFFSGLDEPLDFFDEVGGGGFDGFHEAFGAVRWIGTGSNFSSCTSAGVSRCGSRKCLFVAAVVLSGVRGFGAPSGGRPAAMFSARSISCVWRFSNNAFVAALFADDVGARLRGFAVGLLRFVAPGRPWAGSACHGGAGKIYCHS